MTDPRVQKLIEVVEALFFDPGGNPSFDGSDGDKQLLSATLREAKKSFTASEPSRKLSFKDIHSEWVERGGSRSPSIRSAMRWVYDRSDSFPSVASEPSGELLTPLGILKSDPKPSGDGVTLNILEERKNLVEKTISDLMKDVLAVRPPHADMSVCASVSSGFGTLALLNVIFSSLPKETSAVGDGKNHPKVQAALMGVLDELSAMSPEEFDKALTTRDEGGGNG